MSTTRNSLSKDVGPPGKSEEAENSLRPAKRRGRTAEPEPPKPPEATAAPAAKRSKPVPVPEEVRKRFVQIRNAYFFNDGARAFTDRGSRLTTPSENTEVVKSLVAIAEARGWSEVVVRGTERFRREAWAAARTAGIEVRGYKPTEFEQSRLVRTMAGRIEREDKSAPGRERPYRDTRPEGEPGRTKGLLTGTLVEHGRAPYRHDPKQPPSYYVKFETALGDRTVWGVDLERAMKESLSRPVPGDRVALRSLRQEPVTVKTPLRDAEGAVVGQKDLSTHRNRWIVEKQAFLEERARAAQTLRDTSIDPKTGGRKHPELTGSYLQVRAAELAAQQLRDPQDQKRFVEKVREALAASVARGEPLLPVRLKEERKVEPRSRPARTPEPAMARG